MLWLSELCLVQVCNMILRWHKKKQIFMVIGRSPPGVGVWEKSARKLLQHKESILDTIMRGGDPEEMGPIMPVSIEDHGFRWYHSRNDFHSIVVLSSGSCFASLLKRNVCPLKLSN